MNRYLTACKGDTRKAMTLYRYNLQLSQEAFTIISCFEVALRNAIDANLTAFLGAEWLKDSIMGNGIFTNPTMFKSFDIINRITNFVVQVLILIPNCWQKWSLVFGNICSLPFNTVLQADGFCAFSRTRHVPLLKYNTTTHTFSTSWTKSTLCVTVLRTTNLYVSICNSLLSTHLTF